MARGTGNCKDSATARSRGGSDPATFFARLAPSGSPEAEWKPPRAKPVKTLTREQTDVAELDALVAAFVAADPEIPNEWREMNNQDYRERGLADRIKPLDRLSQMRFDPEVGTDQPSCKNCGNVSGLFNSYLKERGAYTRGWGAGQFLRDPAARPQPGDLPPEWRGSARLFYLATDVDAQTIAEQGLAPGTVLTTTPEAAGPGALLRIAIQYEWHDQRSLRRVADNAFCAADWESGADADILAVSLKAVEPFDRQASVPTAERIELLSEIDPRHPTNLVAAGMNPNPLELMLAGELDSETGVDWSELYGYGDGKYRRRKDKTHETTVLVHRGKVWSIDFTAGQYAYDAFPMVQGYDPAANRWTRDF
jgi:hypothetical protein